MKFKVTAIVLGFTLILTSSCDENLEEFVDWYPKLEDYKFYPKLGSCYEVYDRNDKVTPLICQRPFNLANHSCIQLIQGEKYCLGLKTPTNETVQLLCNNTMEQLLSYHLGDELKNCFNISRPDKSYKEVCQKKIGNYSIGITTPDNFTILFDSHFCPTSTNNEERETYNNFITTFSFNPEAKSCYKIYNEHQKISPYTCFNDEVFSSCVEELSHIKNCEGITTQYNETVVLQCTDNNGTIQDHNCFTIYTANNTRHVACLKRVEERCIGITTPSNLTILLECYFCSKPGIKYASYNAEQQIKYRKFIKSYLSKEYLGKNSYLERYQFESFKTSWDTPKYFATRFTEHGYWIPNSDCYGVTLESNETIILECLSKDKFKHKKPGCFPVVSKLRQDEIICTKVLNDTCVGITTPSNWSITLACYSQYENVTNHQEVQKKKYAENSAEDFRLYPGLNDCYEIYSSHQINPYSCRTSANPKNYSCIQWIPGKQHCLGLKTPSNETIEFVCGDSQENVQTYNTFSTIKNCFNIYDVNNQQGKICQQKIGNYSVGLITPSNYSILLDSLFCPASKTSEQIQEYKEFIGNYSFDASIRNCYKIYKPDEDISPYTCLSDEVHNACTHLLENTGCMGITTQNNETVILECLDNSSVVNKTGCFKIHTPDNKVHGACLKQVEERCMGIVTPSNLTVLLECQTCFSTKGGLDLPVYSDSYRKVYRSFIDYSIYTITQNNYALENKTTLSAYSQEQDIRASDCYNEIKDYDIHILFGHDNCRGVTLENFETIILDCPNKLPQKIGCYDVFSPVFGKKNEIIGPTHKVANVCVKILNEWCVGITTPGNWTIPLSCLQVPETVCPPSGNY